MPEPPSRWRFFMAAALIPAVLAALIGWTGVEYRQSLAAQEEAARSFARERAQLMLLSALKDAETAQRGFLLTGDPAFLAPYAPARAAAARLLPRTGAALERQVAAKFAELDDTIAAFRAGDVTAARRAVASGEGKRIMDGLREAVERAGHAEHRLTAERLAAYRQHRDDSRQLLTVTAMLFTLVLIAITVALWRSRCDRYRAALAGHEVAERNAAILASTSDTLLIVDPAGTIEMVNAAGAALLGYAPEELAGCELATVLAPEAGGGDLRDRSVRPARDMLPERRARRRDGRELIVDIAVGVMQLPTGEHLVLSLRDASERLRLERAKDELISTISHELRTPLTSVVGSLALLRAAEEEGWSAQTRRLIDIADNNARRLIRLINDMLEIDRIESGELPIAREPLDLRTVTAQAALDGEGLAQGRGVLLVDDVAAAPVPVAGDAGRLLQVVMNLVSNAVQASTGGDRVTLRARVTNGRATVSVEDRGGGIPEALRPRLFQRFQSHRAAGGTGLGLAIAREIVRRLDGTIGFEDRVGGGTRFVFDLPLLRGEGEGGVSA